MHAAVQFHNQASLGAVEVDNVWTQRVLPAEFEALELNAPQQAPRRLFGVRWRVAKFERFLDLCAGPSKRTRGAIRTHVIHGFRRAHGC